LPSNQMRSAHGRCRERGSDRLEKEITIRQVALNSSVVKSVHIDTRSPNASHLAGADDSSIEVRASTLDGETSGNRRRGHREDRREARSSRCSRWTALLETRRPLLIFEYNESAAELLPGRRPSLLGQTTRSGACAAMAPRCELWIDMELRGRAPCNRVRGCCRSLKRPSG